MRAISGALCRVCNYVLIARVINMKGFLEWDGISGFDDVVGDAFLTVDV